MANLNRVMLIGNLTRDPELRYVPSGTAVANFSIAVNRIYTSQSGEKKKETCFVRTVVWGRMAEICGEFLAKGSSIFIEGRLQSRSWEGQDGQKRNTIEVVANNVQFLDRLKGKRAPGESSQEVHEGSMEQNIDQSRGFNEGGPEKESGVADQAGENPPF